MITISSSETVPPTLLQGLLSRLRHHNVALFYTAACMMVAGCTMLAGIFTVRWIPPAHLGLWQSVRLAVTYSMFALMGVSNGLSRDLPYYMGKGDEKASKLLASTTQIYILWVSVVAGLGGVGTMLVLRHSDAKLLFAIAAVTLYIIFTFNTNYLIVTFRSSTSFKDLTKVKLTEGMSGLAGILLIAWMGYEGMLLRTVGVAALVLWLMYRLRPLRVSPVWDQKSFLLLLKTGFPIFALDYLITSSQTADRLVLLHTGGVRLVGFYALALMARDSLAIVPGALSDYIYPRMSFSYGQNHDPLILWRMAIKSTFLLVGSLLLLASIGWVLMPVVVAKVFPKYIEAVPAARCLIFSGVTAGAEAMGKSVILSMKSWTILTWYQALNSIFVIVGPIVGVTLCASPLMGVALGLVAANVLWCPVAWGLIYRATHCKA